MKSTTERAGDSRLVQECRVGGQEMSGARGPEENKGLLGATGHSPGKTHRVWPTVRDARGLTLLGESPFLTDSLTFLTQLCWV